AATPVIFSCLLVTCFMVSLPACHSGKVLVFPLEGSHWLHMDILIKALHAQGHSVTVVRTNKSWYIKEESSYYSSITVHVTDGVDEGFVKPILNKVLDIERGKSSALNFFSLQVEALSFMSKVPKMMAEMVTNIIEDKELMKDIKETQYDLVLTDPAWGAGVLMAHYLQLPLVYNVRWVTFGEGHQVIAPSPVSYIPMTGSGLTDKMTFTERVKNMLIKLLGQVQDRFLVRPYYQAVCDEYFQPGVDFNELIQGADLWLMRVDFVFEFPRPTMPNVIYMGGFQCKPAKGNMQRLSKLHRDQPMNPLDLAMFWIEYVMRHKGTAHLRTESYRIPWYSYHSLDVMTFLLASVLLILLTTVAFIRCLCFRMCCRRKMKHE
uniref:Uncharacterized protein n=1 Tax=Salmo trutta TaxID=8032 RepID=A0A673WRK1_SALTR